MAQIDQIYKQQFRKHFSNHEANFPPTRPIEIGAYGVMERGYFKRYGNIKDTFGIDFIILPDNDPSYETFKSEGSLSISNCSKGDIGLNGQPLIKAQICFGLSSEKSLFFSAADVRYMQIKNLDVIGQKILDLYKQKIWKKKFLLVSTVLEAGNSFILISGSTQSSAVIEAKTDETINIDLSNVNTEFNIKSTDKVSYEVITSKCQIGFSLSRVFNPLFIDADYKTKKNNSDLFSELDNNESIDLKGITFGNVFPGIFDI